MATAIPLLEVSYEAAESLADDQYRFVVLDATSGKVRRPNAATDIPLGILQNAPASGEAAAIMVLGISKCQLGETVAIGEFVKLEYNDADDAGKGLDADAENDFAAGICLAGGDEDELGEVLLNWPGVVNVETEVGS